MVKPEEAEKTEELFGFQKIPPQQETETSQQALLGIPAKSRSHVKAEGLAGEELTLLLGSGDTGLKWRYTVKQPGAGEE